MSEWVAGSDFSVDPDQTADVPIALTPMGQQLVQAPDGYTGNVYITLQGYGRAKVNGARYYAPTTLLLQQQR
jgi:hypothetical protein